MARIRLSVRNDNLANRRRKLAIMRKASELSLLCDTDIGVAMFNDNSRLIVYAGNGSSDNLLIHYGGLPEQCRPLEEPNHEQLEEYHDRLKRIKATAERLGSIEDLQKRVHLLEHYGMMATRRLRNYELHQMNIRTFEEAKNCELYLLTALRRVRAMKEYLLHDEKNKVNVNEGYNLANPRMAVRANPAPNNGLGSPVAQGTVSEGEQLVPQNPTDDMLNDNDMDDLVLL